MTGLWPALKARALGLLWPRGLGGRTILVLSAAVVVVHLSTVLLYHDGAADQADAVFAGQVASRLATAAQAMAETVRPQRDARAHALSSPELVLHWGEHAATEAPAGAVALPAFRRRLQDLAPGLGDVAVQFGVAGAMGAQAMLSGSVRLADGTFLNFSSTLAGGVLLGPVHSTLLSTTLMAVGVVGVASMLLRSLIRPLRRLALAADAIGRGPDVAVAETGPEEVRHVAQAFNGMQARIHQLMQNRTQALAAVSHDLRTPITRLRLRAGFLDDPRDAGRHRRRLGGNGGDDRGDARLPARRDRDRAEASDGPCRPAVHPDRRCLRRRGRGHLRGAEPHRYPAAPLRGEARPSQTWSTTP